MGLLDITYLSSLVRTPSRAGPLTKRVLCKTVSKLWFGPVTNIYKGLANTEALLADFETIRGQKWYESVKMVRSALRLSYHPSVKSNKNPRWLDFIHSKKFFEQKMKEQRSNYAERERKSLTEIRQNSHQLLRCNKRWKVVTRANCCCMGSLGKWTASRLGSF